MNLTLHIIGKDLVRFRASLFVWGVSCLCLWVQPHLNPGASGNLRDYLQIFSVVTFAVLSVMLISAVVYDDHPNDSRGQWRTRPISAARMVTAKLVLIGFLFVVLPVLAVWIGNQLGETQTMQSFREYSLFALVLASLSLSLAATAACTKKEAHGLLLWVGLIFATGTLIEGLIRFLPKLSMQLSMQMNLTRGIAILAFSAAIALAVILNQYVRRQLKVSIALLVVGCVGSALMGTLWSFYYFYQS